MNIVPEEKRTTAATVCMEDLCHVNHLLVYKGAACRYQKIKTCLKTQNIKLADGFEAEGDTARVYIKYRTLGTTYE